MGQEILYCCKCNSQLRSADFKKGTGLRIGDRACCAQCAPALLLELSPRERADFFRQRAGAKEGAGQPAPEDRPMSASTVRRMLASTAPPPRRLPPWIMALAGGGLVLLVLIILLAVGPGKRRPPAEVPPGPLPTPGKAAETARPPPSEPAAVPRELLRLEEARRKLDGIKEADRSGRFAADEIRRRYGEFARDYADTPEGRTIADWLKATEPKPQPPAVVEAPKPPDPTPPEPPPKPADPEPVVVPVPKPPTPPPAPPPPPRPPAVRLPPPDAARIREAEAAVRESFKIGEAKDPAGKAALARDLLRAASTSATGEAELWALLSAARDLAAQAADVRLALEAVDALAASFEVDPRREKFTVLTKTPVKGPEAASWARACLEASVRAEEAGAYDLAVPLAERAEALAATAKDDKLLPMARDWSRELRDLKKEVDHLEVHFRKLETQPEDPAAATAVGKFLCLWKEDWDKGLPMLARGTDAGFKKLAEAEQESPAEPAKQAALGDAWAAQAAKESGKYREGARARARSWLEKAIPGLESPAKALAQKKLASLQPAGPSLARAVRSQFSMRLEGFSSPPGGWKAFRTDQKGHQYGHRPSAEAGGEPGEAGGTFARGIPSYYADLSIEPVDPARPLSMSGRLAVPRTQSPDCDIRLGYFDKSAVEGGKPAFFVGISISESRKGEKFFVAGPLVQLPSRKAIYSPDIFELPTGKRYRFQLEWTPQASGGGVLEMKLFDEENRPIGSRKAEVPPGTLTSPGKLDAFGLHTFQMTSPRPHNTMDIFVDDLRYTGRQP